MTARIGQYEYRPSQGGEYIDVILLPGEGQRLCVPLSTLSVLNPGCRFSDADLASAQSELSQKMPEIQLRLVAFFDDFNSRVRRFRFSHSLSLLRAPFT
jgi:hypothetical protein